MIEEIIITAVAGFILLEIIEHVVFPLVWSLMQRRKGSICDLSNMVGRTAEVKQWDGLHGKILIDGEIWNAKSVFPMFQVEKVIIEKVEGFVVTVKKVPKVSRSGRKS